MAWRGLVVAVALALLSGTALVHGPEGGAEGPLTEEELRRAVDAARAATLLLSSESCGNLVRGSAFAVSGHVLTNHHLVTGAGTVDVVGAGVTTDVPVLATHPALDLAVVAAADSPELELADDRPPPGSPLVLAGRPGGGQVAVAESQVHLYSDGGPWGLAGEVLLLDTPTGAGWSGGPVLDRQGRVVAVLAARDQATGLALAVPVTELGPWIASGGTTSIRPTDPCPSTRPSSGR